MSPDHGSAPSVEHVCELLVSGLAVGDLEVPALSDSVVRLLELCRDDEYRVESVVGVVSRDPALAGQVLRVANSAVYAPKVPIETVGQAVTRLGGRALSEIALAMMLKEQVFRANARHAEEMRQLWLHSSIAGIYALNIGLLRREDSEATMLTGLLHDIGRPLVIQLLDDVEHLIGTCLDDELREEVVATLHPEVGGLVIREWGLSGAVEAAAANHHHPFAPSDHRDAAITAHLADELAHWAADPGSRDSGRLRDHLAIRALELPEEALGGLFSDPERVRQLASCF
ncbi:MAG: HDOD domain-containing protein [Planctomycetota bacterium]|jgi:HD-like signal output (HDOD) protein